MLKTYIEKSKLKNNTETVNIIFIPTFHLFAFGASVELWTSDSNTNTSTNEKTWELRWPIILYEQIIIWHLILVTISLNFVSIIFIR